MAEIDKYSRSSTVRSPSVPEAIGESEAFLDFQAQLSRAARVDRPVLIVGERGTGKELAAARLHYLSSRWEEELVALNCAALSPTLIESELFGYERGAFTGAEQRRAGRFEAADQGTLFLDEIGLVPMEVQEKILRAVEYQRFERVGGTAPIEVDVRIIGATNADLASLAEAGKFKSDLLDRLSFEVLFVPPLRERKEDILLLASHFAARMAVELGRSEAPEFSGSVVARMEEYRWPGNIRELKNVVERAVYRSDGLTVYELDFEPLRYPFGAGLEGAEKDRSAPEERAPQAKPTRFALGEQSLPDVVAELEKEAVRLALGRAENHQGKAAELLGLSYHQFRRLLKKRTEE